MQQMMIYWQSIILQRVSGIFTPIIRRADCVPLPMVSCPDCGCCGSRELGGKMCALCTHLATRLCAQDVAWPDNVLCTVHTSRHPTLRNHNTHSQDRKP